MTAGGVEIPHARPARVVIEPLDSLAPAPGHAKTDVPLPGQGLDQGASTLVEDRLQVAVGSAGREDRAKLGDSERALGQGLAHRLAEPRPLGGRQLVVLLPAGQLPLPAGTPDCQVRTAVLGREVVHAAAERERLDDLAVGKGPGQLAFPGGLHSDADSELGQQLVHGQHGAQPPDYLAHRLAAHRSEQMPGRPPR
jgi:hypothetical protein